MGISKPSMRQKSAALALAVGVAGIAIAPFVWMGGTGDGPDAPPWVFPPVSGWLGESETWTYRTNGAGSTALIYVDRNCVHCKAELELWESVAKGGADGVAVWVVASPRSVMERARWVPPSLRTRTVHDRDGSVGRTLGVSAVPATFWIDETDTVRIVRVGRSNRNMLGENIAAMTGMGETKS